MSSKEELKLQFEKFAERAVSLGITGKRLGELNSVRSLLNETKTSSWSSSRIVVSATIVVLAAFAALALRFEMYTSRGFTDVWFTWKRRDFYTEQCTVDMPNVVQDIFRPPVKCSICNDVHSVDTVTAISSTEFQEKYAYTGRPVVITDATKNWTALKTFSFDFFKSIYADDSPALENFRQSCQFFPYQTEFHSLREVFEMHLERSQLQSGSAPWYVGWSNCDSTVANILRQHYARPYFLPEDAESSKTDWIFMGSPGYGAHMHIDHVGNPSWQAQISGQKKWTLVPPPECAHECHALEVTVQSGDIIVLDTNSWFHQTLIVGTGMSITIGSEYD